MQHKTWTKEISIKNGRRPTSRYRYALSGMGFVSEPQKGRGTWTLRANCSESDIKTLKRFCKRKHLEIIVTDRNLVRSQDYRKNFNAKTQDRPVRCAYCGKKLTPRTMTVDHIVPVSRFKGNRSQAWLEILGIDDINEYGNLAPACYKCNRKKGRKGGLWILRGLIGKNYAVRTAMNYMRLAVAIAGAVFICRAVQMFLHSDAVSILMDAISEDIVLQDQEKEMGNKAQGVMYLLILLILAAICAGVMTALYCDYFLTDPEVQDKTKTIPMSSGEVRSIAETYLEVSPYSRKGLVRELVRREKLDTETAKEAVSHMDTDWTYQAKRECEELLNMDGYSKWMLIRASERDGYTKKQIGEAVESCGADYMEQAARRAQIYEKAGIDPENIRGMLEEKGFTSEEAIYGANEAGLEKDH